MPLNADQKLPTHENERASPVNNSVFHCRFKRPKFPALGTLIHDINCLHNYFTSRLISQERYQNWSTSLRHALYLLWHTERCKAFAFLLAPIKVSHKTRRHWFSILLRAHHTNRIAEFPYKTEKLSLNATAWVFVNNFSSLRLTVKPPPGHPQAAGGSRDHTMPQRAATYSFCTPVVDR